MKYILLLLLLIGFMPAMPAGAQTEIALVPVTVSPGDSWAALAWAYQSSPAALQALNPHPNPARSPAMGATIQVPAAPETPRFGRLLRPAHDGLWSTAAASGADIDQLARQLGEVDPFAPLFYRPVVIPGGTELPHDLPAGMTSMTLSAAPAQPGQLLALGLTWQAPLSLTVRLDAQPFIVQSSDHGAVAVLGTGAFFPPGAPLLTLATAGEPGWSQPWQIAPGSWLFQEITLTGNAATITSAEIAAERERLFALWANVTPIQWTTPFALPIDDFLRISSPYGVRRSYNGGPYRSYHEGVDFSAYGGTPVMAPAGGTVVLAEFLRVRGGAVIIDHGLGIFSGFYHLSEVQAVTGQTVATGDVIGNVGTTGLSTGNHLHWDLIVGGIWVDGQAWLDQAVACDLLALATAAPGAGPCF